MESPSAACFVASAVRFLRKTFQTETGVFYVVGPGGSKSLVRRRGEADDEFSVGLGTGEPARHAVRNVGWQDLSPSWMFETKEGLTALAVEDLRKVS